MRDETREGKGGEIEVRHGAEKELGRIMGVDYAYRVAQKH